MFQQLKRRLPFFLIKNLKKNNQNNSKYFSKINKMENEEDTVFGKIVTGKIPCKKVYEDDLLVIDNTMRINIYF